MSEYDEHNAALRQGVRQLVAGEGFTPFHRDTNNLARVEALARRIVELEALIARINRGLLTLPVVREIG